MSVLPLASARLKNCEFHSKTIFYMQLMQKFILVPCFFLFLVFKHDFIRCVDFIHIAASNTAGDDVTN